MNKTYTRIALFTTLAAAAFGVSQEQQTTGTEKQTQWSSSKNIVENLTDATEYSSFLSAIRGSDQTEALNGTGPFTVFAPSNKAFTGLPAGAWDDYMKAENKEKLTNLVNYHVVKGRWSYTSLGDAIQSGDGKAELMTVSGGKLWARWNDSHMLVIKDEQGNEALVTKFDIAQRNGVVHTIDRVLMPNAKP